jgi:shikimate kinase
MFIALIGYRGSGKSTIAQAIALRLGWDWVDADVEIELAAGKSIAAIFADDGEHSFRDLEHGVLAKLVHRQRAVLALGGGAVLRTENRELLRSACHGGSGKTVWLKAAPETLWRRIQADPSTAARRPNLTVGGGLNEIHNLLGQREELYRQCADLVVETDGKSLTEVAEEILAWMKREKLGAKG